MKDIIYQRVYETVRGFNGQGKPFANRVRKGLVLAHKTSEGTVEFGYSSLHRLDTYDEKVAFQIAMNCRSPKIHRNENRLPTRISKVMPKFIERAKRYFKDATFAV